MARTVITFQGETLTDAVDAANAAMSTKLNIQILGLSLLAGNATRIGGKEFHIILTYDNTGVVMSSPFLFYGVEGKSDAAVDADIQSFYDMAPGMFITAPEGTYLNNERSTVRYARLVVYNLDSVNGNTNWLGGGTAPISGVKTAFYSVNTVLTKENNQVIYSGTGGHTFTLPAANALGAYMGVKLYIKNLGSGDLTVAPAGGDTIDFSPLGGPSGSITLTAVGRQGVVLISNGSSNWAQY